MAEPTKVNFIGCGNVGRTIGHLLQHRDQLLVQQILCRSNASATAAVEFIGSGTAISAYDLLQPANCWFIATNDSALEPAILALAAQKIIAPGDLVLHFSGSFATDILQPLAAQGALTAAMHPVLSFADPKVVVTKFTGSLCALSGSAAAKSLVQQIFSTFALNYFAVKDHAAYHAACVMANNFTVGLQLLSQQLLAHAGVDAAIAKIIAENFATQGLDNCQASTAKQALTGPAARGDNNIITKHQQKLAELDPDLAVLYQQFTKLLQRTS